MKKVHYSILEDMRKYMKGVDLSDYEKCFGTDEQDSSTIAFIREYYDNNLPVDVTAWIRVNEPSDTLIYKDGLSHQLCFVRDTLNPVFYTDYEEAEENPPMVISTHTSKSVRLPIYQIDLKKYGIQIILRNNFYAWSVSIKSVVPIDMDVMGLFDTSNVLGPVYCNGFPKDKIYGCYDDDKTKFTFEISDYYKLYTFIFLFNKFLENKFNLSN